MWVMFLATTGLAHSQHTPLPSPPPALQSFPHLHFSIFTATFRTVSSFPRPKAVASTTFPKAPAPRVFPVTHKAGPLGPRIAGVLSLGRGSLQPPVAPPWSVGELRPHLTKLQVVAWELPLLVVGQLGGIDKGIVVALITLDDFPAHLVLGLLQKKGGGIGQLL